MWQAVSASWALFAGLALLMLGNGLQGTLLGVRADLEQFGTTTIGLVMSAYYVGFLAGSVMAPRLVGRVGHIRVFAAMASIASTAVLLQAILVEPVFWSMMRCITGFCFAALFVVAESWLNDRADNRTRGQLLGIYMVVATGGMGLGQFFLNLADPLGFALFAVVSVLVSLALVPILLTVRPAPDFEAPAPIGLIQLYATSPLGVFGSFGVGMAHGALLSLGAVYAQRLGFSNAAVSVFMAAVFFGAVVLQFPIGRASDYFDRRQTIFAVSAAAALLALAAWLTPASSVPAILLLAGLFGGTSLPLYALCVAHTNDYLEHEQMVAASGALYLVVGIGAVLGPLAASGFIAAVGPGGFFLFLCLVHATIGLFALYRMTQRPAVPMDEQGAFAPVPHRGSPMAATLNPEYMDLEEESEDQPVYAGEP